MKKLLLASACAVVLAFGIAGCKNQNHDNDMNSTQDTKRMSTQDDCSHCPGVQHAMADGTCPQCGAKVK